MPRFDPYPEQDICLGIIHSTQRTNMSLTTSTAARMQQRASTSASSRQMGFIIRTFTDFFNFSMKQANFPLRWGYMHPWDQERIPWNKSATSLDYPDRCLSHSNFIQSSPGRGAPVKCSSIAQISSEGISGVSSRETQMTYRRPLSDGIFKASMRSLNLVTNLGKLSPDFFLPKSVRNQTGPQVLHVMEHLKDSIKWNAISVSIHLVLNTGELAESPRDLSQHQKS